MGLFSTKVLASSCIGLEAVTTLITIPGIAATVIAGVVAAKPIANTLNGMIQRSDADYEIKTGFDNATQAINVACSFVGK